MVAAVRIWQDRISGHEYAIGVDPALGYADSDDSVIEVGNCNTGEQVAEVQGKLDGNDLAEECDLLGNYYNEALIGVEINKDLTCVNRLWTGGYPNLYFRAEETGRPFRKQTDKLGWDTNIRTRPMLVTQGRNMLTDGSVVMKSQELINQWKIFVLEMGKFQALAGGHDDLVMGFLIMCEMMMIQLNSAEARTKTFTPMVNGVMIEKSDDPDLTPRSKRLSSHVMSSRREPSHLQMDGLI